MTIFLRFFRKLTIRYFRVVIFAFAKVGIGMRRLTWPRKKKSENGRSLESQSLFLILLRIPRQKFNNSRTPFAIIPIDISIRMIIKTNASFLTIENKIIDFDIKNFLISLVGFALKIEESENLADSKIN